LVRFIAIVTVVAGGIAGSALLLAHMVAAHSELQANSPLTIHRKIVLEGPNGAVAYAQAYEHEITGTLPRGMARLAQALMQRAAAAVVTPANAAPEVGDIATGSIKAAIAVPLPPIVPAPLPAVTASLTLPEKRDARPAARGNIALPTADSGLAVYDITAKAVYLPSGQRLEAHSGLGEHMDDPRSLKLRMRGVTPPNVYDLSLREAMFHGVRAIRLTPLDDDKMYGRDGILAHTYMLGPNGQSNGCVSFSNYQAFLQAFLRGEVNRMIVVPRLADLPSPNVLASLSRTNRYASAK
jgi:hypothetical protein